MGRRASRSLLFCRRLSGGAGRGCRRFLLGRAGREESDRNKNCDGSNDRLFHGLLFEPSSLFITQLNCKHEMSNSVCLVANAIPSQNGSRRQQPAAYLTNCFVSAERGKFALQFRLTLTEGLEAELPAMKLDSELIDITRDLSPLRVVFLKLML